MTQLLFVGGRFYNGGVDLAPGVIPSSVTDLNIRPIPLTIDSIPSAIATLDLYCNQEGLIPSSVRNLTLNATHQYCRLFPGVVPFGVTQSTLTDPIDWLIPDAIPASVSRLRFTTSFHVSLSAGLIPTSVTHLTFDGCFPFLEAFLPNGITHLKFAFKLEDKYKNSLGMRQIIPSSVLQLTLYKSWRNQLVQVSNDCDVLYE